VKILFTIASLNSGGEERVLTTLANELSKKHEVIILKSDDEDPFYEISKSIVLESLCMNKINSSIIKKMMHNFSIIKVMRKSIRKHKSDVVILPSRFEGMSMFALEALYTKNLVIFTNTGGIKDMVKDNGYLVEVQNIEELADKLNTITNLTHEEINEMKENSFKHYKDSYAGNIIKNKFLKILKVI
jgi:hypothetical protein